MIMKAVMKLIKTMVLKIQQINKLLKMYLKPLCIMQYNGV